MVCLRSRKRGEQPVFGGACCGVKLAQVTHYRQGGWGSRLAPFLQRCVSQQMTGCSLCSDAALGSACAELAGQATSPWSPQSSGESDPEWRSAILG